MARIVPLNSTFMLTSIIGFFVVAFWPGIWESQLGASWAFALCLVFTIMFIASMVSMSGADPEEEWLADLAIHERRRQ